MHDATIHNHQTYDATYAYFWEYHTSQFSSFYGTQKKEDRATKIQCIHPDLPVFDARTSPSFS